MPATCVQVPTDGRPELQMVESLWVLGAERWSSGTTLSTFTPALLKQFLKLSTTKSAASTNTRTQGDEEHQKM